MANYGPPGGGTPDPWREQHPDEVYGPSAGSAGRGWENSNAPWPPRPASGEPPHGAYPAPGPGYAADPYRPGEPAVGYGPGPYVPADPGYGGTERGPGYGTPQGHGAEPGYGTEAYRSGAQRYASYSDAAGYADDTDPAPERPRDRRPMIAVLAAVVVLLLVGGAAVFYLLGQDDEAAPVAGPTDPAPATAEPTAPPSEAAATPDTAAPESSADPRFVRAGQCVRNDGPAGGKPKLLISECGPKSYEVLRRIDGPTTGEKDAEAKCAKAEGYTNWYFFDSELDTLDFVLCLKQR